jgi:O-acetyl-ADP-ribose deacetylase (regulator of RNase III)
MQIEYKTGDLLEASEPVIVHGCNAQGAMRSGVAKVIRAKYPGAYEAYEARHKTRGLRLGDVIWADCGPHIVANAITQEYYGRDGRRYADYDAIEKAFTSINETALATQSYSGPRTPPPPKITAVALPLIGAGLAGGSWKTISEIIEHCSTNFQPVVYLIDGKIPES